jgi:hypothetical protein
VYSPEPFLGGDLGEYLARELRRIAETFQEPDFAYLRIEVMHRPPERAREGLIVAADGVGWNPGSGAGVYAYYNSAWHKLG